MSLWLLLLLLLVTVLVAPRLNEQFRVFIRDGRVAGVRGRVPPGLLDVVGDVARDARVRRATVRAIRGPLGPRLVVRGVDERTAQRLRNAFGVQPRREPPGGGRRARG